MEIKNTETVATSSSEAEYYALSEAAKDIKFIYQILTSIGIQVLLPIVIYVDNVGAIFLEENVTATNRTKHVDIRYHFVREFIYDGFLKIIFVQSKYNSSDIFTKNLSSDLYHYHKESHIVKRENLEADWKIEGTVL
jgi:hypothetical protein